MPKNVSVGGVVPKGALADLRGTPGEPETWGAYDTRVAGEKRKSQYFRYSWAPRKGPRRAYRASSSRLSSLVGILSAERRVSQAPDRVIGRMT